MLWHELLLIAFIHLPGVWLFIEESGMLFRRVGHALEILRDAGRARRVKRTSEEKRARKCRIGDAREVESTSTEGSPKGALSSVVSCEDGSRLYGMYGVCLYSVAVGRLYTETMRFSMANICPLFRASACHPPCIQTLRNARPTPPRHSHEPRPVRGAREL